MPSLAITLIVHRYPPWMTGTIVTKSPSCKIGSSEFKTDESTPLITIKKLSCLSSTSAPNASLFTKEIISFIDAGYFSYTKEEHPVSFLKFPRKRINITWTGPSCRSGRDIAWYYASLVSSTSSLCCPEASSSLVVTSDSL
jgi:hypothetical protein